MPDYADFTVSKQFVPMVVEIPDYIDINTAQIKMDYDGSNPANVKQQSQNGETVYLPAPGSLRLWQKNGTKQRNVNPIQNGGDYVQPGQAMPILTLVEPGTRVAIFYLEAVKTSDSWGDLSVRVELLPDTQQ